MKNVYFLFLIVSLGMCEKTFAQSRWVGIMPMEFNPSFAGSAGGHRVVALGGGNTVSTEFSYAKVE